MQLVSVQLTAHSTHDFIEDEQCAKLVANRLHGLEVALRRRYHACSRADNSLCDNLEMISSDTFIS